MLFLCSDGTEYRIRPYSRLKLLNIPVASSETRSRHDLFFSFSLFLPQEFVEMLLFSFTERLSAASSPSTCYVNRCVSFLSVTAFSE